MKINLKEIELIKTKFGKLLTFSNAGIGSLIHSSDVSKNTITFVVNGKIRLIDNQNNFTSKTLEVCSAPYLLGFTNLLNIKLPNEIRAYSKCEIINLNLVNLNKEEVLFIFNLFKNKICSFEYLFVYTTLKRLSQEENFINQKINFTDLKNIIKSNNSNIKKNDQVIYLDWDFKGFKYGQIINGKIYRDFFESNDEVRVGIIKVNSQSNSLETNLKQSLDISPNKEKQEIIYEKTIDIKLEEKSSKGIKKDFEYPKANKNFSNFDLIKANDREGSYFACISMIIKFFDMPTTTETIKRASKIIEDQKKSWSTNVINLLDRLGLSVRPLRVNKNNPLLVPTPSIWIDDEGNCNLILKSNSKFINLYSPIQGLKTFNKSECLNLFKNSQEIITVEVGLNTPKKRFNLAWLFPYVKKFRNQLFV